MAVAITRAAIRFLSFWRGREAGQVDRQLDPGVMDALVHRGAAEWYEGPQEHGTKEVPVSEPPPTKPPKRRKR
jgi:hypothetical protein